MSNLEMYKQEVESQLESILNITRHKKIPDWSMTDLDKVLRTLKKSQSEDTMSPCE